MKNRPLLILFRRFVVPEHRFFSIFLYAKTRIITEAHAILCNRQPLFGCFSVPHCRHFRIFFHTISIFIAAAKIIQRLCIAVIRSLAVPSHSLRIVSYNTDTIAVADTQFVLRLRITLLCCLAVQLYSLCLVLADAVSGFIALAQFTLRFRAVLLSRFCIPLYSRHIVRECHIQPPGHILCCCISLSCRRFVPSAGLFVIFFNTERLIIAFAQCALRLRITLLGSFFVPCNGIFRILRYTNTILVTPCHFQLCLWASVITGRNHVALKRHFGIANLLKITGILQIVLLGFRLRFLLRFLTQTKALHEAHEFSLFILRPIEQEAVYSVFLSTEIHILDFSA